MTQGRLKLMTRHSATKIPGLFSQGQTETVQDCLEEPNISIFYDLSGTQ